MCVIEKNEERRRSEARPGVCRAPAKLKGAGIENSDASILGEPLQKHRVPGARLPLSTI